MMLQPPQSQSTLPANNKQNTDNSSTENSSHACLSSVPFNPSELLGLRQTDHSLWTKINQIEPISVESTQSHGIKRTHDEIESNFSPVEWSSTFKKRKDTSNEQILQQNIVPSNNLLQKIVNQAASNTKNREVYRTILKNWLFSHFSHPYPSEDEKKELSAQTGLTMTQITNWFISARRKIWMPYWSRSKVEYGSEGT